MHRTRLHGIVFASPVALLLTDVFLAITAPPDSRSYIIVSGLFAMTGAILINYTMSWFTSEFVVTTRRVVMRTGFIRRVSLDLMLSNVDTVVVEQGALWKVANYGTVVVYGTGGARQRFRHVARPMTFLRAVQRVLSEWHQSQ